MRCYDEAMARSLAIPGLLAALFGGAVLALDGGAVAPRHDAEIDNSARDGVLLSDADAQALLDRPVIWVSSSEDAASAQAALVLGEIGAAVLHPLLGDRRATALSAGRGPEWWAGRRAAPGEGPRAVLGVDLNVLRASDPGGFADQRLNEALHALGLANARGLVLEVAWGGAGSGGGSGRAELTVSYRSWSPQRGSAWVSSIDHDAAQDGRVAVRARWSDWIESISACERALLDHMARPRYDAERSSWDRRHGRQLRAVLAGMEGPILAGWEPDGAGAFMMVGLARRADESMVAPALAAVLETLCERSEYDDHRGRGIARVRALVGTVIETLEWSVVDHAGRRWILASRPGAHESLREILGAE